MNLKIFDKLFEGGWNYLEEVLLSKIKTNWNLEGCSNNALTRKTIHLSLLDLGSGNGIFTIYFLLNLVSQKRR